VLKLKAHVHEGRLKLDEPYDAPEGTEVDLAVVDDGDDLDEEERARLHTAIARGHDEAQRGEVVPADEVLAPHGITATHADQINAELLAFINSSR
jgi:hypothetical protein